MADIFSKEKRSAIMSRIRSKDTKAELILRKALYAEGLRYRLHCKSIPGKPDIVFKGKKVAVFVDGDWWHGRNFEQEKERYPAFWRDKIAQNVARDKRVDAELQSEGWKVFRFWQKDIEKSKGRNIPEYIRIIKSAL